MACCNCGRVHELDPYEGMTREERVAAAAHAGDWRTVKATFREVEKDAKKSDKQAAAADARATAAEVEAKKAVKQRDRFKDRAIAAIRELKEHTAKSVEQVAKEEVKALRKRVAELESQIRVLTDSSKPTPYIDTDTSTDWPYRELRSDGLYRSLTSTVKGKF